MSDLDQLLARIDTTLTECDASTMPPLGTPTLIINFPRLTPTQEAELRERLEQAPRIGKTVWLDRPRRKRALWRRIFPRRPR